MSKVLKQKRISFVAATRNRCEPLKRALAGWESLKGPDDELIVVDGNSSDGTKQLLKRSEFVIDKWLSEPDVSEAHALNKGILLAEGRYIKLLTDDDIFYPHAVKIAARVLDCSDEVDIVHTGGECVIPEHSGYRILWYQAWEGRNDAAWWRTRCGLGALIRRSSFAKTGLFDVRHRLADTSFFIQASIRGAIPCFIQCLGFTHRREGESFTASAGKAELEKQLLRIARDHAIPWEQYLAIANPRLQRAIYHPSGLFKAISDRLLRVDFRIERPDWDETVYSQCGKTIKIAGSS